MDGDMKKRKMDNAEAEEDNEEEKMERFYALIRSTRVVRERMMMSNADRLRLEEEEQKKNANENKPVAVWNPTFQPEDFMEDQPHQLSTTTATPPPPPPHPSTTQEAGPSNSKKEDDEVGGDHQDLDLKLSL